MTKSRDIANSTSTLDVDGGTIKLDGNYPVGSNNVALGDAAMSAVQAGADSNTAVGRLALTANTTADYNTAVGGNSLRANTTGHTNSSFGQDAMRFNSTGASNVAVGQQALHNNTTASNNTAVGYQSLYTNTTGTLNTSVGKSAMFDNTTGGENTALGVGALANNTTASNNTAIGRASLVGNTTGAYNTAVGSYALQSNTTASNNTAVGYQAGNSNTTASNNAFLGYRAGYSTTTGNLNTFVGNDSGYSMTTGTKNTILGRYNGNSGGLDIRTSSNNIVLSDGDGNPRLWVTSTPSVFIGDMDAWAGDSLAITGRVAGGSTYALAVRGGETLNRAMRIFYTGTGAQVGGITFTSSSTSFSTSSDYRLKENVDYTWDATTRLKQLKPARFNFIADADTTVDGFLAHEAQAVVPECVAGTKDAVDADGNPEYQGIDQSKLVPLLVKTIQELEARITALEA
jgi:hypothetical protein